MRSVKRPTIKGLRDAFFGGKKARKLSGFVMYSYFKDSALTAVRDAKF